MLRCRLCGSIFEEHNLVGITHGGKSYSVCPDCLESFLKETEDMVEEVPEEEVEDIRAEWRADERYDEEKLEREAI